MASKARKVFRKVVPKSIRKNLRDILHIEGEEKTKSAIKIDDLLLSFGTVAAEAGYDFLFSVIIPVYNAGEYLDEAIMSIVNQSIGFENIQILLIDDGSVDNSWGICKEYQQKYPNNIEIRTQENQGVSKARNVGLELARGLYVNFLDSDDKWSLSSFESVLRFLKKYGMLDLVASKEMFFGSQKGPHPRNFIFAKDHIVNVEKEYQAVPIAAPQTFIKRSAIGEIRFKENLLHSEDARFITEILFKAGEYGAMSKPTYFYRKSADSSSAVIATNMHYYSDAITLYHDYIIERAKEEYGEVPWFIQNQLVYNISWRIKDKNISFLEDKQIEVYKERIRGLLQYVDDEVILSQKNMFLPYKLYLFAMKYGYEYEDILRSISVDENGIAKTNINGKEQVLTKIKDIIANTSFIQFFHVSPEKKLLTIEGFISKVRFLPEQIRVVFTTAVEEEMVEYEYEAEVRARVHDGLFLSFQDKFYSALSHYRVTIPVQNDMKIEMKVSVAGSSFFKQSLKYGAFAKLNEKFKNSAFFQDCGYTIYLNKGDLFVSFDEDNLDTRRREFKYREALTHHGVGDSWLNLRKYAFDYRKEPHDRLWLFSDRLTSAEDSGEELFRYVNEHPIEGIETAFIIREDVPDYERLQQYGRVIAYRSEEHFRAMLVADKVISTAADASTINPFGSNINYLKDLLDFDFVFLQHGVIKDDLSAWLHRANKNISLFVTSSEMERQSILNGPYGYNEDQVILTGLPRFDTILRGRQDPEKMIFIMPTWREWLAPAFNINARSVSEIETKRSGFQDSDYFKFYNGLLSSKRLHQLLEENDYHVYFALHPRMGAEMESFYADGRVHLLMPESFSYSEAFQKLSMLITDYSSVAFNVALLRKPVIYAQFDYNEFYLEGKHTATEGYYSFKDNGFGPVVTTVEEVIDQIEIQMKMGPVMEDEYHRRADDFFFTPPNGMSHSEMVLKYIETFDSKKYKAKNSYLDECGN